MIGKLEEISKQEHLRVDDKALFAIAKAAGGSMRDAETILDQLSSFSKDKIDSQDVSSMLGMVEEKFLFEIADCIIKKDTLDAIKQLDALINKGKDPNQFIINFIEHFRNLMVAKVGGRLLENLLDLPDEAKQRILKQSQNFSAQEILNIIEVLIQTQETARFIDSVRIPIEMALTKLTLSKQDNPHKKLQTEELNNSTVIAKKNQDRPKNQNDNSEELNTDDINISVNLEQVNQRWSEVLQNIAKKKMSVATYLQEAAPESLEKNKIIIRFPMGSKFHKEFLEHKDNTQLIQNTLKEVFNMDMKVSFIISKETADGKHSDDEPLVKSALNTFKGKVIGKWYRHD